MSGWWMVVVVATLNVLAVRRDSRGDHVGWALYAGLSWVAVITHVALGIAGVTS